MERLFNELTYEEEVTARLYSEGYEKKEIAELKCRAVPTINNQLQSAFNKMHVRNGRELAKLIHERLSGVKITFDLSQSKRAFLGFFLFGVFSLTFIQDGDAMRRGRRARVEQRTRRYGGKDSVI